MKVKVNLGCGPVGRNDWINLDWGILALLHRYRWVEKILLKLRLFPRGYNVQWAKNLKLHNCKRALPFSDCSVDYIYTSHFLEHFKKYEAKKIIQESYRVLKKGGTIRITVPDLGLLAEKYFERDNDFFQKINELMNFGKEALAVKDADLADIFLDNFYPAFYKEKPRGINKIFVGFIRPHLWMYDEQSLGYLLEEAGFEEIQRKDFKIGKVPDLEYLDNFPQMTLYMEATK